MSPKELEREFRNCDADHNLYLDFDEYSQYMNSIHSMLGHRSFMQLCTRLLEEAHDPADMARIRPQFDAVAGDLLLDKLRGSSNSSPYLLSAVEQLLGRRADPNYADGEGSTLLLLATGIAAPELVVQSLLQARADPSLRNKRADSALLCAARSGEAQVAQEILATATLASAATAATGAPMAGGEGSEASLTASVELLRAIPEAGVEDVRELLAQRADVNHRDENGWTAMIAAVFWGRRECMEALLRHQQLNPNTVRLRMDGTNRNGLSPLHVAARKGRHDLMPLLMSSRCNPDLPDNEGWTPLHHAAFNGMDDAVQALVARHACLRVQGKSGFTPWMVSSLPTRAGKLEERTLRLMDPGEHINFSKQILPILGSASLAPYDKLQELYDLPSVAHVAANLRLYEHFFHSRTGPNRVRLTKMWEGLARDLLLRLRSGQTDAEPRGGKPSQEQLEEQARRWHDQKVFLRHWFQETRGPPPGHDWPHDSREAYRAELDACVAAEMKGFRAELDGLYQAVRAQEGAAALLATPAKEVLLPALLSQLGAHPIPTWLDQQDAVASFRALCEVRAFGSHEPLRGFLDLLASRPELQSPEGFWSHVYKVWLHHHALQAQGAFQHCISAVSQAFNEKYGSEGLHATMRAAPVKSYERMLARESDFGVVDPSTQAGRWVASRLLDVVRSSLVVNSPRAAVVLLEEFFRPLDIKLHKASLVQIVNNFSPEVNPRTGYRDLVLNVYHASGVVGEVQIILSDFLTVKKRMYLLVQYQSGDFDHHSDTTRLSHAATHSLSSAD